VSNPHTEALSQSGVSIWLDDLSRARIDSGQLAELIEEFNIVGVTTNPTIFATAIGGGVGYEDRIAQCAQADMTVEETITTLTCADVADACDLFSGIFDRTEGRDGRVSIEVSPRLARDTAGTLAEATQLWERVDRPNAMIKIPATHEGLEAITQTIAQGISVNVTLIFSLARYRQVINAYLTGIELARAAGLDISKIQSVASFFVSRVDTEVDGRLRAIGSSEATALTGRAGISNARLAYEIFEQSFESERARLLRSLGAHVQRPLWASTGVKDPAMPDTHYVTELVAPNTINTMPEATLRAVADHGDERGDAITGTYIDSNQTLNAIDAAGVDYVDVTEQLEREGLEKFETSWSELEDAVTEALRSSR